MTTQTTPNSSERYETIKLGIGAHARWYYVSRQRQQLVRERQRLAAMGRSLLAMHGLHVTGRWWKGKTWARIKAQAPGIRFRARRTGSSQNADGRRGVRGPEKTLA